MFKIKVAVLILILVTTGGLVYKNYHDNHKPAASTNVKSNTPKSQAPAINYCAGNTLDQEILVSIAKQHLWACTGTATSYDSAVITGMEMYANDLTPPGTYKIYAKQTNTTLTGSDQFGSWSDPVSYWMPFLSNNYGVYGFHDAQWRNPSDFGNVNIYAPGTAAKVGSHGCVELPLATAKWIYDWAPINTTVVVQS